jgi:hypothetical protein
MGVGYKTAFRWWKAGKLDVYQLDIGTVQAWQASSQAVEPQNDVLRRLNTALSRS